MTTWGGSSPSEKTTRDTYAKENDIGTRFQPTPDDLQWTDLMIHTIQSFDANEIKSALAMAAVLTITKSVWHSLA